MPVCTLQIPARGSKHCTLRAWRPSVLALHGQDAWVVILSRSRTDRRMAVSVSLYRSMRRCRTIDHCNPAVMVKGVHTLSTQHDPKPETEISIFAEGGPGK